jgi:hypothetical protein
MNKKNQFIPSNEILEIEELHAMQAKNLIAKLRGENEQNVFIELDCMPNGNLNPFHYGNGLKSAKIIRDLAGSFLAEDLPWLESNIYLASNSKFETNFQSGIEVGLWEQISSKNYNEKLNWEEPFCVKNEKGLTRIWHPEWRRLGYKNGFSTRMSVINFIHEGPTYLQKYYSPLTAPHDSPTWKMHYRLVFLAKSGQKELDLVGGLWISRPAFKIYLDKSSLVGLISPITTSDIFL